MLQLNPPLPLDTPAGPALAHIVLDDGPDHDVLFVCFLNVTGECQLFAKSSVKAQPVKLAVLKDTKDARVNVSPDSADISCRDADWPTVRPHLFHRSQPTEKAYRSSK